jgi:Cu/Ag efflux protein CusF
MRSRLLALTSIASLLFLPGSYAAGDSSADNAAGTTSAESGQAMTAGLVKKVDKDAGKITISHGPLENLGMPKMTMVFRVKDPAMLDRLKEGDKILFVADKVDGAFTVMSFESAK